MCLCVGACVCVCVCVRGYRQGLRFAVLPDGYIIARVHGGYVLLITGVQGVSVLLLRPHE